MTLSWKLMAPKKDLYQTVNVYKILTPAVYTQQSETKTWGKHDCCIASLRIFLPHSCTHLNAWNNRQVSQIINSRRESLFARNADLEIPLHVACKDDENKGIVEVLLKKDHERQLKAVNRIYGNTPLHIAACLGNREIVDEILKCGNSTHLLKKINKLKDTPVHSAASRGHVR